MSKKHPKSSDIYKDKQNRRNLRAHDRLLLRMAKDRYFEEYPEQELGCAKLDRTKVEALKKLILSENPKLCKAIQAQKMERQKLSSKA